MAIEPLKRHNVRVIPDAGDVVIVGADKIAKLSAETSLDRSVAAWDQRIVQVSRYRGEALGLDCSKQNLRRARFYLAHFSLFPSPLTERNYDAYFNLLHRSK